jgi:hypothetical protein
MYNTLKKQPAISSLIKFLRSSTFVDSSTVAELSTMLEKPSDRDGICVFLLRALKKAAASETKLILTLLPLLALLAGGDQVAFYCTFCVNYKFISYPVFIFPGGFSLVLPLNPRAVSTRKQETGHQCSIVSLLIFY